MKRILVVVAVIYTCVYLSGCSVGMALSGNDEPNLTVIQPGADRATIELQLGSPVDVKTSEEGMMLCKYEFEVGNEPSAGRAVFHGAMDVLTLGGWELIGTPVEGFQGKKRQVVIGYNSTNKVQKIN